LAIQSNNNKVLKTSEPSDHETFNGWNLPKITVSLEEGIAGGRYSMQACHPCIS